MSENTAKTRTRRSFWDSTLQAPKVRAALESLGVDPASFEAAYRETRKTRTLRPVAEAFTPEQINAIKAFRKDGDIQALATALNRSMQGAAAVVARALAQGIYGQEEEEEEAK